jgi:hypothetical protein
MLTRLALSAIVYLSAATAGAATINADGCGNSAVQAAINAAASGDTILLPAACTATWSGGVTIPGAKAVTLDGNRSSITRSYTSQVPMISVNTNAGATTRVTGFTFSKAAATGGYNWPHYIAVDGGWANAKFRVDHNTFNTCGGSDSTHVRVGSALGLIDHNNFYTTGGGEIIHIEAYGNSNTAGWSYDVRPGSDDAVYVEDNNFYNAVSGNPAYYYGASAVQAYYGARWVFRHNLCRMCQVDNHGTAGMIGGRWWEIYDNTFDVVQNGNQSAYISLRAGSGVLFNNHVTGSANLGGGGVDLYEEDSGYPALYQVGRGKNQVLDPAYIWANDSAIRVASSSSNVQLNRDFYLTAKAGYNPYIYPHPLSSGEPVPAPPSQVIAQ